MAVLVALDRVAGAVEDDLGALRPPRPSTYEATLSRWAAVISGPISEAGSLPGPILIFSARSRILSTSSSPIAPTATTTEMAMQRSPAEP